MGFFNRLFFDFGTSIGVDLGTASILIYVKNKGIVLNEPSVVAMNQLTHEIIAIGAAAKKCWAAPLMALWRCARCARA